MPKPTNSDRHGTDQAEPLAGPLNSSQLAAYRKAGWLLAQGFFVPVDIDAIAGWIDDLLRLPEEPGRHFVYREPSLINAEARVIQRIENFCPYHAGFDAFVRDSRLRQAVDQLLGGRSCLFKDKINFKMPGGAGFEPHQDQQAGWSRYAAMFVTALVTIDRATVDNGCLEIADGARLAGLIGDEWRPLTPSEMAGFSLVTVPTEPGDVLFFDSYAPHASKPNLTDHGRRILYLTYNAACEGDHRIRYFADKRASFPPDVERRAGVEYKFRV